MTAALDDYVALLAVFTAARTGRRRPPTAWRNAHSVADESARELTQIETEAYAAAERRTKPC